MKNVFILTLMLAGTNVFAHQLHLSDGKSADILISYDISYEVSGSNGGVTSAAITKISMAGKNNQNPIKSAKILIDKNPNWLLANNTVVSCSKELTCINNSCEAVVEPNEPGCKFQFYFNTPFETKSVYPYAIIEVNGVKLNDPLADEWRKSAFQLVF